MYKNKKISVSIPIFNEEKHIKEVVRNIPKWVDLVVVVNDASTDNSEKILNKLAIKNTKLKLISAKENLGVGASILTAHNFAFKSGYDISVVINGDNQMDTTYLPKLLEPLVKKEANFTKGMRLYPGGTTGMPLIRLLGNIYASLILKIATQYWKVSDPLNGYTAITKEMFSKLDKRKLEKRFGYETSLIIELSKKKAKIVDVKIPAIYGSEETKLKTLPFFIEFHKLVFRKITLKQIR
ncbi:MAG: glycosyltransferase family 2 protein [Patescibacteria group bacterium]